MLQPGISESEWTLYTNPANRDSSYMWWRSPWIGCSKSTGAALDVVNPEGRLRQRFHVGRFKRFDHELPLQIRHGLSRHFALIHMTDANGLPITSAPQRNAGRKRISETAERNVNNPCFMNANHHISVRILYDSD